MPLPAVSPAERYFSPQTVCVWATGLYIARWYNPAIPATKDEVIALAAASGVTDWYNVGRANFFKLAAGMKARYGLTGRVLDWSIDGAAAVKAAVLAAASAGPCAIGLAGNQLNLTPHWQSGSIGHAIAAFYPGGTTGTQLDPLAPQDYAGDPFPPTEMGAFTTAAIIFAGAPKEDSMTIVTYTPFPEGPRTWTAGSTKTYVGYKPDGTTTKVALNAGSTAPASGTASISQMPQKAPNGSGFVLIASGPLAGHYLLRIDGAVAAPPLAPVPDCAGAVKAATDPLNARIVAIKAKVAAGASDISDD